MIIASDIALIAALGAFVVPTDMSVPAKRAHESLSPVAEPTVAPPSTPATTTRAASTPDAAPRGVSTSSPPPDRVIPDRADPVAAAPPSSAPPIVVEAHPVVEQTSEYVLDIPYIDLREPVIGGGQDEIDQGGVTAVDWSSQGYPSSCLPGEGCTVWLAGHRTTHDAVFARLPELTVGVAVAIHFHGQTYAYTVTGAVTVPGSSPPSVIVGDLVLQTSAPGDQRVLIYAEAAAS
jgi:LPXTG-site transpeptidase (sortase) family protein